MRAIFHADEGNGHIRPRFTQQFEFEFVHVGGFAVEEDEEGEFRHSWGGLPAECGIVAAVAVSAVLVREVGRFHHLPALHNLRAATEVDARAPVVLEVGGGELADVFAVGGECDGVDAGLGGVFLLGAGDHVMQDAVDEVFNEADIGGLVVEAADAVGADQSGVGVPGHGAGDVD